MGWMNSRFVLASAAMLFVLPSLSAAQGDPSRLKAQMEMRQKQAAELEARPTPHMAGGYPDLSGNWTFQDEVWSFVHPQIDAKGDICFTRCGPAPAHPAVRAADPAKHNAASAAPPLRDFPAYKAQYLTQITAYQKHLVGSDPLLRGCPNPGLPRIGPPAYIIQTAKTVVFLYDNVNGNFWRVIPTDGEPHNADADPSALGDSVGKWIGGTLVVEAVNFSDDTWLTDYGAFHSSGLKVVERFTRKGNAIIYEATAYDPVLAKPWTLRHLLIPAHDRLQPSAPCINEDMAKMVNDSYHANPP